MEEIVSPELAQTPKPESSQDLDSSSQAPALAAEEEKDSKCDSGQSDAAGKEQVEEVKKSAKNSGELRKTWGFRRTTIAKRDMAGETAGLTEGPGAPVRRSGRQAKRTDKLEEFLVTVKRGRGVTRRSAPAHLEGGDPPSESASEASFDGSTETKVTENKSPSPVRMTRARVRGRMTPNLKADMADSDSEEDSSENEESATQEVQEKLEMELDTEEAKNEEAIKEQKQDEELDEQGEETSKEEVPAHIRSSRSPLKSGPRRESKPKVGAGKEKDEEEESESSSSESDHDGYDPNALYCICRQKHNKRFMICCDRCEEWFHGDCVGITEARGRLMERNSEDYVCPNCTGRKAQGTKSSTSTAGAEAGKRPATPTAARKAEPSPLFVSQANVQTSPSAAGLLPATTVFTGEEKIGEEVGIKGRIEKATNPSGKKKIKIFQPQVMATAEESSLPKCIGPGCERDALPDSVYCGNDCILKHAAAAMKTITTDSKETKPKEKPKPKILKKPAVVSTVKSGPGPERRSSRRSTDSSSKAQEESLESESREDEDDEDEEDRVAEEHPPPPAMSSWSSDHNYIAVAPEKTTAISPTVLNKACMYLKGFPHFNLRSLCDLYCSTHLKKKKQQQKI